VTKEDQIPNCRGQEFETFLRIGMRSLKKPASTLDAYLKQVGKTEGIGKKTGVIEQQIAASLSWGDRKEEKYRRSEKRVGERWPTERATDRTDANYGNRGSDPPYMKNCSTFLRRARCAPKKVTLWYRYEIIRGIDGWSAYRKDFPGWLRMRADIVCVQE